MRFLEKALERLWFSCGGHCQIHGDGGASCPLLDGADPAQRLQDPRVRRFSFGGALVGAAVLVFLVPLATALGGAYVVGAYLAPTVPLGVGQMLGMLAGLAVGVGIAKLVLRLVRDKQTTSGGGDE